MDAKIVTEKLALNLHEWVHGHRREDRLERLAWDGRIACVSGIAPELRPSRREKKDQGDWYIHRRMLRHER
jgi:hypothetical protein